MSTPWDRITNETFRAWMVERAVSEAEFNGLSVLDRVKLYEEYNKRKTSLDRERGQKSEKRQKLSLISGRKAILPVGVGALRFEGLHDRESSKEDLFQGLEYLASSRGVPELDKKEVPVLGIAAPSESGKTEFLRWIFNNCCTVSLNAGDAANNLLGRINAASPPNVAKLDRLIVLFASFNQKSTYNIREGPIVVTAIKRLVRSYQGRTDMQGFDADDAERNNLEDLVNAFSEEDKTTGFVVCIDELSKLRQLNSSA